MVMVDRVSRQSALVAAMKRAVAAEEDVLAHLLRCEVGTLRYKDALGV
jgi:hypothetical protein